LLLPLLLSSSLAASLVDQGARVEDVQDLGSEVVVRVRREAGGACRYKKGDWSRCDPLTQLETREDRVKAKGSLQECAATRTLTRHCKQDAGEGHVTCVFKKSKSVPWTDCLLPGVRQKVLDLVSQTGEGLCPKQKLLSRKCKDEKKAKEKKDKKKKKKKEKKAEKKAEKEARKAEKDKCQYGVWGEWGECTKGRQQRLRKVTGGSEVPACQKKSVETRPC